MTNFIRGIVGVFVAVVLTAFCVQNSQVIPFVYLPFYDAIEIPQYLLILGTVLFGFILGAFVVWLNGLAHARAQKRLIKSLEKEVRAYQKAADVNDAVIEKALSEENITGL